MYIYVIYYVNVLERWCWLLAQSWNVWLLSLKLSRHPRCSVDNDIRLHLPDRSVKTHLAVFQKIHKSISSFACLIEIIHDSSISFYTLSKFKCLTKNCFAISRIALCGNEHGLFLWKSRNRKPNPFYLFVEQFRICSCRLSSTSC